MKPVRDVNPVRLAARCVHCVEDGEGLGITAVSGTVWITQACDRRDVILTQGQSFILDRHGRAVVYALRDAAIVVGLRATSRPPRFPSRPSGTVPPDPERVRLGMAFRQENAMMRRAWNTGYATVAGAVAALVVVAAVGAAALAQTGRSVLIVLDASGSMNQPMPEGGTRLEAAKAAVSDFLGALPADIRLGLRAYGHQSPLDRKNCEDSQLVAGFASGGEAKVAILAKLAEIRARGYTPITRSLQSAAQDIRSEPASDRIVVLVSDGHETCKADPCAAAKALVAADAKLVIHAIGLGVDDAARRQLQCIASVAGGAYFDARSQAELAATFSKAAAAKKSEVVVHVVAAKTGFLALPSLKRGGAALFHAETGKAMDFIGGPWPKRELQVGIYNVKLANGVWTGIQVKPGETTVLQPALLRIENGSSDNMELLDPETNEQLGHFNMLTTPEVALVPGHLVPRVGKFSWPAIEAMPGRTTVLRLAMLRVNDPSHAMTLQFYVVSPLGGGSEKAFQADKRVNLPPGKYLLWNMSTPSERTEIEVADGQTMEVRIQRR